jgi:protein required for attachment to host cells
MATTWLIVANASQATLYETETHPKTLTLLKEFFHPASRAKGSELASDRPGHFQGEALGMEGTTHGAFNEPIDPKEYEHERFAIELVKALDAGRSANRYENLIIAASPHFHGLLNKHMNEQVAGMVSRHIEKDYTTETPEGLLGKLR